MAPPERCFCQIETIKSFVHLANLLNTDHWVGEPNPDDFAAWWQSDLIDSDFTTVRDSRRINLNLLREQIGKPFDAKR